MYVQGHLPLRVPLRLDDLSLLQPALLDLGRLPVEALVRLPLPFFARRLSGERPCLRREAAWGFEEGRVSIHPALYTVHVSTREYTLVSTR